MQIDSQNAMGLDLGELLYEHSDARTQYDAPTPSSKKGKKVLLTRAYILVFAVGLVAWFITSLILQSSEEGFGMALIWHLSGLFGLVVAEVIILLTAFQAWGKFIRFALRRNLVNTRRGGGNAAELRKLAAEIEAADENKPVEDALRIYRDFVVVINRGVKYTLPRECVTSLVCTVTGWQMDLVLVHTNGRMLVEVPIPRADLPILRKHLPVVVRVSSQRKENQKKDKLPLFIFSAILLVVGGGIAAIHFTFAPELPLLFPITFWFFAVVLFITAFDFVPLIKHGLIPLLFGVFFAAIPVAVLFSIAQATETAALSLLMPFTIVHAVLLTFFGFGLVLIISGVAGFVASLRHRK